MLGLNHIGCMQGPVLSPALSELYANLLRFAWVPARSRKVENGSGSIIRLTFGDWHL